MLKYIVLSLSFFNAVYLENSVLHHEPISLNIVGGIACPYTASWYDTLFSVHIPLHTPSQVWSLRIVFEVNVRCQHNEN
jgi:hypothetical protein